MPKNPETDSELAFSSALKLHSNVSIVSSALDPHSLQVILKSGPTILLRQTDIYCVGEADVREFLEEDSSLNAIVTLSAWNMVSSDAARYGRELEVGVFTWKQFFGAIHYKKYWLYEELPHGIKDSELATEKRRRRAKWN